MHKMIFSLLSIIIIFVTQSCSQNSETLNENNENNSPHIWEQHFGLVGEDHIPIAEIGYYIFVTNVSNIMNISEIKISGAESNYNNSVIQTLAGTSLIVRIFISNFIPNYGNSYLSVKGNVDTLDINISNSFPISAERILDGGPTANFCSNSEGGFGFISGQYYGKTDIDFSILSHNLGGIYFSFKSFPMTIFTGILQKKGTSNYVLFGDEGIDVRFTELDQFGNIIWNTNYPIWPFSLVYTTYANDNGYIFITSPSIIGRQYLLMKIDDIGNFSWSNTIFGKEIYQVFNDGSGNGYIILGKTNNYAYYANINNSGNMVVEKIYAFAPEYIGRTRCGILCGDYLFFGIEVSNTNTQDYNTYIRMVLPNNLTYFNELNYGDTNTNEIPLKFIDSSDGNLILFLNIIPHTSTTPGWKIIKLNKYDGSIIYQGTTHPGEQFQDVLKYESGKYILIYSIGSTKFIRIIDEEGNNEQI